MAYCGATRALYVGSSSKHFDYAVGRFTGGLLDGSGGGAPNLADTFKDKDMDHPAGIAPTADGGARALNPKVPKFPEVPKPSLVFLCI